MSNAHEPPEDAAPALVLSDRYRLRRRLGVGGFGRIWLAHDDLLGVEVAVKEVKVPPGATAAETEERVERAAREARNAALLRDHPNIVTVHDVVIERGTPWIVMQYLRGRSLAQEITQAGPLPVARAGEIAGGVLSALEACHALGIIHRDVKPANIMLGADGSVTLTDFGIAKQAEQTAMTAADEVIGSVEYLAPECVRGLPATPASDLFSLGVTLYHAIEGVSPFKRGSGTATLSAVLLDDLPTPPSAGPLAPLIRALTRKNLDERPSVDYARWMLATGAPLPAKEAVVAPAATDGLPSSPGRKPVRRRIVLGTAVAACAGAATAGAVAAISAGEPQRGGPGPVTEWNTEGPGTLTPVSAASIPIGGGVVLSAANLVVVRLDADTYRAFSATCPHLGCQVAQVADNQISCPCHGSVFRSSDGSVVQGPATRGLSERSVTVSGDSIRVS
jgi:Rieske Fe-S protein